MPIHQRYVEQIFEDMKTGVLSGLDVSGLFLKKIQGDSDWSFVIKVQTLVETSLTEGLVRWIGELKIKRFLDRLPLSDEEVGKLALAKDLGILDSRQRQFVRRLAQLRNNLAHRADHADFSLPQYISNFDSQKRAAWQQAICWFSESGDESRTYWREAALNQPRLAIWLATYMLVALINLSATEREASRSTKKAALKTAEELYESAAERDEA
ncbi:hypothetical protein [Xanthomonas campestris]|uniref:hypothetical protein n=1 Tax=Xanthomonas campestris TaxID=339 RepID=UPI0023653C3E|nr:hypothetical protein [Xanthomonas campestris]MEA9712892.1 hypothetical protein [Xanthomonas campestris]MEA9783794.1 hypothetical protein [Xanthomonas campestris pv. raphani]MEA9792204.1 hypothetical protein [Xanthomonas campestris pv. raphani]MEA9803688.1 hypothetical protein [Xanthomonas campestris pv. raphani]MEA9820281.1 hypothetical protein [Xanthomonas campestris pv. raphani]